MPTLTRLLSLFDDCLLDEFHLLHAIAAQDVDDLGGSHTLMADGADIFAGATGLPGFGGGSVACPFGQCPDYIPQADRLAHLKVLASPVLL